MHVHSQSTQLTDAKIGEKTSDNTDETTSESGGTKPVQPSSEVSLIHFFLSVHGVCMLVHVQICV